MTASGNDFHTYRERIKDCSTDFLRGRLAMAEINLEKEGVGSGDASILRMIIASAAAVLEERDSVNQESFYGDLT